MTEQMTQEAAAAAAGMSERADLWRLALRGHILVSLLRLSATTLGATTSRGIRSRGLNGVSVR